MACHKPGVRSEQADMLSVIIPTLNAEAHLAACLAALLEANTQGLIRDVIITDGGSEDHTLDLAEEAGARIVRGPKGRGGQLRRGAEIARGEWLLFLHADTVLAPDWLPRAMVHMNDAHDRVAAVFRLRFAGTGVAPWLVATGANWRTRIAKLPYGDQGLLIAKPHYDRVGGFQDMPLFEDVEMVRRIVKDGGANALRLLPADAITSPERYEREGYMARVWRNSKCVRMYFGGAPLHRIMEVYHGQPKDSLRPTAHPDGQAAPHGTGQDAS